MTLTAEKPAGKKTPRPNILTAVAESEKARAVFGTRTITLSERDFDRLFRCSSHRLLIAGRGELRALFEHGGDLYAILAADEALAESSRAFRVRLAQAMRVVPSDDYQGEATAYAGGSLSQPDRLEGMVVQHQGIGYVMTGGGVSFATELQEAPTPAPKRPNPVKEINPQGIPSRERDVTAPAQLQIPPIDTSLCAIPLQHIGPSVFNPRENFDEEYLAELAASIKESGLMQPITVRPVAEGRWIIDSGLRHREGFDKPKERYWQILDTTYLDTVKKFYSGTPLGPFWSLAEAEDNLPRYEIIAGECRWRASKIAETGTILALVRHLPDDKAKTLAVVENLQRKDLDPFEESRGFKILLEMGWSQGKIAEQVGCNQSRISRVMGLSRLPEPVQQILRSGALSPSHGQRLLAWSEFPEACLALAEEAAAKNWPVKKLEGQLDWEVAQLLKEKKVVREINQYDTAFDWKDICVERCPFRAFRPRLHGGGVCLKPPHYAQLQKEAKRQQAEEEKGATDKAKTALRNLTPAFTELPMVPAVPAVPVVSSVPPVETVESPAPGAPDVSGIPKFLALKGCVLLAEGPYAGMAGQWVSGASTSVVARPSGCSQDCPCAGVAVDRSNQVCQVCTDPKRRQALKDEEDQAEIAARVNRADRQLTQAVAVLEAERAEGLPIWEATDALRVILLHHLRESFNGSAEALVPLAALYGVTLTKESFDDWGRNLQPDAWRELTDRCSIPELLLMAAELRIHKDAEDVRKGYGYAGKNDLTGKLLALGSQGGMTLSARETTNG